VSERPAALDALRDELERVIAIDQRERPRRVRRIVLIALAVALLLAGVAAAATLLIGQGSPIPQAKKVDVAPEQRPVPRSQQLAHLNVADPAGGPAWDVRLSRSQTGETCTAVGQVLDGRLGIVGLDGLFRAAPLGSTDTCGTIHGRGVRGLLAGAKIFNGRTPQDVRTVVSGVAGAHTAAVVISGAGRTYRPKLGPRRAFLAVFRGYGQDVRPRVTVSDRDGTTSTLGFYDTGDYEAPDPDGGPPWKLDAGPYREPGSPSGLACAQAVRERGPGLPQPPGPPQNYVQPPLTPILCGFPAHTSVYAVIRRFVPEITPHDGFPWGLHPARTLVYGAAAATVRSLVLEGAGAPGPLRIRRPGGGFLAVLDGHVDPRALSLHAVLDDGRQVTVAQSNVVDVHGKALTPPPVPPWRPVPAKLPAIATRFEEPVKGSVAIGPRTRDPAGGPDWAVRAWAARLIPGVKFVGPRPKGMVCFQWGTLADGKLLAPAAEGRGRPLGFDERDARCLTPDDVRRHGVGLEVTAYTARRGAYAPDIVRVAVTGLAPGARSLTLLGAGPPRAIRLGPHGSFLVLLPARYAGLALGLRAVLADGTVRTTRAGVERDAGATIDARAPDPDGAAPWAVGYAPRHNGSCILWGRVVRGQLAWVNPVDGSVGFHSQGSECGATRYINKRVVTLNPQDASGPAAPLTGAQIQRRTLPGRTVLTGAAAADVRSVTIRTPSDVRTLRPSRAHHLFIAVYDGAFYTGKISATAHLANGKDVSVVLPAGP
jgi:hypothetical protein